MDEPEYTTIPPIVKDKIVERLEEMVKKTDSIRLYILDSFPAKDCTLEMYKDIIEIARSLSAVAGIIEVTSDRIRRNG